MNTDRTFSERVLLLRRAMGLSQEEFAAKLNIGRTYLSQIETGREPSPMLQALFESIERDARERKTSLSEDSISYRTRREERAHQAASSANDSGLSVADAIAQARSDLETIELGTPTQKRRAFTFLRDVHLPLLDQTLRAEGVE